MLQRIVPQIIQKIVYKIDPIYTISHAYIFLKNKKKKRKNSPTASSRPAAASLNEFFTRVSFPAATSFLNCPSSNLRKLAGVPVHYRTSCWTTRCSCFASGHVCSRSLGCCLFPAQEPKEEKGKTRGATKLQIQITSSNHNNSKLNSSYKRNLKD